MELVNVLMSTYNGEKYIKEQLDSILHQSYHNLRIYVRDDGSSDGTLDILERYHRENKIILLKGDNVGYGSSFMQLLALADEGEYWAFSDQDDIWDSGKISRSVNKLSKMKKTEPNMYYHSYELTDEKMNVIGKSRAPIPNYSFQMAITECFHLGFATVINKELRELMLKGNASNIISHDWWAELIAMEFGNIYCDKYIGAKHRRLEESVSSSSLKSRVRWFFKALKGNSEIQSLTLSFCDTFETEMDKKDRRILLWFVSERYSFIKSLKKCFYYRRWRTSLASEFVVRFLMLAGKI